MARRTTRKRVARKSVTTSLMQKLTELDNQRKALMEGARTEAMAAVQKALGALNSLGFNFVVVERGRRKKAVANRKVSRSVKDAPCPICGFKTMPPHDRRAHRGQGNNKKPFTAAELEAKGLRKV